MASSRQGSHQHWPSLQPSYYHCLWPSAPHYMSTKSDNDYTSDEKIQVAIDNFISTLQKSLDDKSFELFTLKGPSPKKKTRTTNNNKSNSNSASNNDNIIEQQKEKLRGKYKLISGRLVLLQEKKKRKKGKQLKNDVTSAEAEGSLYVQTTIKYHLATDIAKNWKVNGANSDQRRSEVEEGLRQLFLIAMGYDADDTDTVSEWGAQNINTNKELGILSGELVTSDGIYKLQLQPHNKASFKMSKKKDISSSLSSKQVDLSHDRTKNVPLLPESLFFQKLGLSNKDGKPMNKSMASKLRQCQKFVEIVGALIDNSVANNNTPPSKIRVADMGCGRGYLTFSLHSYLYGKFEATSSGGISVETKGIDVRPKLIAEINGIAQELPGDEFRNLNFVEGTISNTQKDYLHPKSEEDDNTLDILIALHACDTATDDSMWFGISQGADIIVTAPCCQHELRPQIDTHASNNPNHLLSDVLRHAIYRERATETITDAMRAILLEIAGYTVQVFEFIGGEHTAKNSMITAQKIETKRSDEEQEKYLQDKRRRLIDLAELHGVKRQKLAALMGESIVGGNEEADGNKVRMTLSGMAPL